MWGKEKNCTRKKTKELTARGKLNVIGGRKTASHTQNLLTIIQLYHPTDHSLAVISVRCCLLLQSRCGFRLCKAVAGPLFPRCTPPHPLPERGPAAIILFVGVDLLLSEQYSCYSRTSVPSGMEERCSAAIIWLVGVDLFPLEEYFHHFLKSMLGGIRQQCLATST